MSQTMIRDIGRKYEDDELLAMPTSYDAPIARLVDAGGVDTIHVNDTAVDILPTQKREDSSVRGSATDPRR